MAFDIEKFRAPDGVNIDNFKNIISAAYTAYVGNGGLTPTIDDVSRYSRCRKKTIARVLDTPEFLHAITARGVNWQKEKGLSSVQMLALNVLTNPADRRDIRAKLRSVGATYAQYQAWLREPLFRDKVNQLSEQMLGDNMINVHQALVNKASSGETRAIELYYQLTGRHDPAAKQVVEMQAIIRLLLEILTKRITDPKLLEQIADDIGNDLMPKMITGSVVKEL